MLATTLGSDFQYAVAPFKAEILDLARYLQGDVHRAAMQLLLDHQGRRPSAMEQQLIIAALAELQHEPHPAAGWERAAKRIAPPSGNRRQVAALQVH